MHIKSNNCKIVTIAQMFLSKWRFICRSRRGCWSSPIPICDLSRENLHWWLSMKRVIHKAHRGFPLQLNFVSNSSFVTISCKSICVHYLLVSTISFALYWSFNCNVHWSRFCDFRELFSCITEKVSLLCDLIGRNFELCDSIFSLKYQPVEGRIQDFSYDRVHH